MDDYIAHAAPFAREPLAFVREAMHAALPDVTEAIKWRHPFYLLDGRPFASMAAFKAHCSLGFWKGGRPLATALRKVIVAARAAWLAEKDDKAAAPPASRVTREAPSVPDDLAAALQSRAGAPTRFDVLTAAQQREYVDWVGEARREATRASRIVQAVAWIAEGKTRNWKYQSC